LPHRNIVVVGASVGGVDALQQFVRSLPTRFRASVFIVLHLSPDSPSLLPDILERAGTLSAIHPKDGDNIREGQIYIAPPDHHMTLERGVVRIIRGPKENRHRPAIDPLFRSAALNYGPQVIGVVLTGSLDDGTAGLIAVKQRGGLTVVEDPESAFCGDMPRSAIRYLGTPDVVLPIAEIGPKVVELVKENVKQASANGNGELKEEVQASEMDPSVMHKSQHPGEPSPFACPECNGVLWERQEGELLHFRCRVGHAYTANSLESEQTLRVESALWAAMRSLEENASLNLRLSERAEKRRSTIVAQRFKERAESNLQQAEVLRKLIVQGQSAAEIA
jgi:two-component system chemotaxis response regulator CheB